MELGILVTRLLMMVQGTKEPRVVVLATFGDVGCAQLPNIYGHFSTGKPRYGSFRPDCVEDQESKRAIFSFLSMWLQKHPQDFCDYPDMATVKRLVDYIRLNVPSSDVTIQTEELLSVLEEQESIKDEAVSDCGLFMESVPEVPMLDVSGMGETLSLRAALVAVPQGDLKAASVAGPQGDLKPQEETELMDLEDEKLAVPEVEPVQVLPSDKLLSSVQPLPTSADTQPPLDVAAYVPAVEQMVVLGVVQLVKRLVDYIRLSVPSSDVTIQTEELPSVLEEQESKKDEEAWDCGLFMETAPEVPMLDVSGMGETVSESSFSGRATGRSETLSSWTWKMGNQMCQKLNQCSFCLQTSLCPHQLIHSHL
ncbi:putative gene 5565 [Cricetulus griseus]